MFEIKMTREEIIEGLKNSFGKEFTAADVRGFCAMNDIAYQTVTKKIEQFKVGRGKWNLEVTTRVVENIEKSFTDNHVLKNVSFNFKQGKTNLIIGESGSGKTTLIKIMVGLYKKYKGEVLFN